MSTKIPKRAYTKPSVAAVVFFIIIVLILTPNTLPFYTDMASMQAIFLVLLSPLVIPGLFCSYYFGLAIAKIIYSKKQKKLARSFVAFIMTIFIHICCVAICLIIEITLAGYPIKMCFDSCQSVTITDAISAYLIFTTILFVPAYYSISRYINWHNVINNN